MLILKYFISPKTEFGTDLKEISSLICVISSHGVQVPASEIHDDVTIIDDQILGTDGKTVKLQDIVKRITEINYLKGKPKIFFVEV